MNSSTYFFRFLSAPYICRLLSAAGLALGSASGLSMALGLQPVLAQGQDGGGRPMFASPYGRQASEINSGNDRRLRLRQFMERRVKNGQGINEGEGPSARAAAAVIDSTKVKVQKDVPYGSELRQNMDIYSPVNAKGPLPVIVFAHGGGWRLGNKSMHIEKGASWAEHGVIFVSINYRLVPEATHPKQIQDVATAFAWVKSHAAELGADPRRLYVMGHSAGAQLVDLLGTNDRFLKEKGLTLHDIKGVISLDTASLDLNQRIGDGSPEGKAVGSMITAAFGTDPKMLADASPTTNVHAGQKYPDFLMFCGQMRRACVAQHDVFAAAMKKAGSNAVVKAVPLNHADISKAAGQPNSDIFKEVTEFLRASGNLQ